MAITKAQARKVRQPVVISDRAVTSVLDASNTSEIVELSITSDRISVQSTGDLAGNIQISINGVDFQSGVNFSANSIATYGNMGPSDLVKVIKVNRTSGSGVLHILAR